MRLSISEFSYVKQRNKSNRRFHCPPFFKWSFSWSPNTNFHPKRLLKSISVHEILKNFKFAFIQVNTSLRFFFFFLPNKNWRCLFLILQFFLTFFWIRKALSLRCFLTLNMRIRDLWPFSPFLSFFFVGWVDSSLINAWTPMWNSL